VMEAIAKAKRHSKAAATSLRACMMYPRLKSGETLAEPD
jgi:hypothetical protein